ncbi:MAG: glycosyl hydrolase 108 family protein [Candidatus Contendobacter sp.]
MGDFQSCIKIILAEEGGLANHSRDHGGLTQYGISQRSYPDLDIAALTLYFSDDVSECPSVRVSECPSGSRRLGSRRMTVENVSRFVIQATGPATQSAYRFGVLAKNRTTKSEMTVSAVPTLITNKLADTSPPTPDDEAGTAVAATQNMLLNDVSLKLDGMQIPVEYLIQAQMVKAWVLAAVILSIKDFVMKGGSVDLDNLGTFRAKWNSARWSRKTLGRKIENPAEAQRLPEPPGRNRWLTQDEATKLLLAARHEAKAPHLVDFILLGLLHTGMRRGELLGLEWNVCDIPVRRGWSTQGCRCQRFAICCVILV